MLYALMFSSYREGNLHFFVAKQQQQQRRRKRENRFFTLLQVNSGAVSIYISRLCIFSSTRVIISSHSFSVAFQNLKKRIGNEMREEWRRQ